MPKFFQYTREQVVQKKDEKGQPIFKKDDQGNPTKEFETETFYRDDFFNVDKVIRTHMVNDNHVIVLLDDGHEVTEKVPQLKSPNKPPTPNNIIEVKERQWVQSEISIKGTDKIQELFEALKSY